MAVEQEPGKKKRRPRNSGTIVQRESGYWQAKIRRAETAMRQGELLSLEWMTLYKAFERAVARAGIQDYTWHDLRHEALSRLAERGDFTVLEIAAVSGHKTLQMLKRYTHLQAEKLAKKLGYSSSHSADS